MILNLKLIFLSLYAFRESFFATQCRGFPHSFPKKSLFLCHSARTKTLPKETVFLFTSIDLFGRFDDIRDTHANFSSKIRYNDTRHAQQISLPGHGEQWNVCYSKPFSQSLEQARCVPMRNSLIIPYGKALLAPKKMELIPSQLIGAFV